MTVRKVEIERFSVTTSKPFELVVAALKEAVGRPDMVEFVNAIKGADLCRNGARGPQRSEREGTDDVHGTRSWGDSASGDRAR